MHSEYYEYYIIASTDGKINVIAALPAEVCLWLKAANSLLEWSVFPSADL